MSRQIKRLGLLLCAAAALAAFLAPSASAVVSLSVEASHAPATLKRGDEYFTYAVTVKNSGNTPTTASTALSLALPAGTLLDDGVGSGWSCLLTTNTCTYSGAAVAGTTAFPVLTLGVLLDPVVVADTVTTTFTATGGGAASPGSIPHSFTLGSPLAFGLVDGSFVAGACAAFPVALPPTTAACQAGGLGDASTQAGGHPFAANAAFSFMTKKTKPNVETGLSQRPFENVRDAAVNLPPGFVANPTVIAGACTIQQIEQSTCPPRFAIGRAWALLNPGFPTVDWQAPIYKIQTENGYPAAFAFRPVGLSPVTVVLRPKVRPGDATVTAFAPTPPQEPALEGVKYFTFCSYGAKAVNAAGFANSSGCKSPTDPGALSVPFLTNPTRCTGEEDVTSINAASYQHPGAFDSDGFPDLSDGDWKTYAATSPPLVGCAQLPFEPTFEGRPTTTTADSPSGLDFDLRIPQDGLVEPGGIATAHLKRAKVVLPEGMTLNPAAATGLAACSPAQMGLLELDHPGPFPVRFNGAPVECPSGAKIGTVEITSPLIDETVQGEVFLAQQDDPRTATPGAENPFDSLLALYIAVRNEEIGLSAKLAGKVETDPQTGQLTTTFAQNPQLPFDHLHLKISEGPRGSLRTPATCGTKTTAAEFTSWSTQTPVATPTDSFATTTAPDGSACAASPAQLPNAPRLSAGTVSAKAGAYSPFVLRLNRDDGSQEIKGLNATLPPGLTGRLAGVPYCSEAQIERARARSNPREGALEQADPSCPSASQLGIVDAGAGAGPHPFHAGGNAYLAGPYKGAPVSMVVITPAVAGPFDLGTVVVRNALYVDPKTTQVSVKSDPIPTMLEGIPLDVRSIEVRITRNQFTLNPTNCEVMSVGATAVGLSSDAALSNRFQANECAALGFRPDLKLQLHGGTKRSKYQQLTATVTYPKGAYANIARAAVTLPHSAFLAQEHINTVCTRVQFAAKACPKGAIYGHATAVTPLLDAALSGPVYLRSSSNPLPDLVAALRGPNSQPIEVELSGRTDSKNGGIRNTFDLVPDAPVSKFTLRLLGGKKSLIINSRNLCSGVQKATVRFTAQNGRQRNFRPVVDNDCGKKKGSKGGKAGKGKGQRVRGALARLSRAW
ncbi:MAG TPA: hypothetical protein VGO66_04945 [Solirubrobacterales bacterium]|jgi:hypothetical protein|nr:hypothetical protein [Solirubrobacterales bacterium]